MRIVMFLAIMLADLFLAGCAVQPSSSVVQTASPAATPNGPLVTVETRGGECVQGACGSTVVIERDGRIHATAPAAAELGSVPESTLGALATEIDQTDFGQIMSRPFTGTCPVAFDGQETVYTFSTSSGQQRIASCEVDVDPSAPLFVAVEAALTAAAP